MTAPSSSVALDIYEPPSTDLSLPPEPDWSSSYRPTPPADACIVRFAHLEADVSHGELVGLGRQSAARFPRLGGVLHERVEPGGDAAALVLAATTRTIRAGYQAVLATGQVADDEIVHHDAEDLWATFVPMSYCVPRAVAQVAWDVCRFEDMWVAVLDELGMERDASRLAGGQVSPLNRSIRGLSTVGVALALAERGARHERQRARRRSLRPRRLGRWDLPSTPPHPG
jgi:hypothetical protein